MSESRAFRQITSGENFRSPRQRPRRGEGMATLLDFVRLGNSPSNSESQTSSSSSSSSLETDNRSTPQTSAFASPSQISSPGSQTAASGSLTSPLQQISLTPVSSSQSENPLRLIGQSVALASSSTTQALSPTEPSQTGYLCRVGLLSLVLKDRGNPMLQ